MIGNNSCGTHSVMAEFYGPGPLTVDQVLELDVLTYRGERLTVGAMTGDEQRAAIDAGGELGRVVAALRDLRDRHLAAIRTGFPADPPARLRLQPPPAARRVRLRPRQGPRRHRGHLRHRPAGPGAPHRRPARADPRGRRLPRRPDRGRPRAHGPGAPAGGLRGHRPPARRVHAEEGPAPRRRRPAPGRRGLPPRRVRGGRQGGRRRPGPPLRGGLPGARRPAVDQGVHRGVGGRQAVAGAGVGPRRHRQRPGHARDPPGLGGRRRAAGARGRLPARLPRPPRRVRLRRLALRPLRPGVRPLPHRLPARDRPRRHPVAAVPRPCGRARHPVRGLALRGARRRAGPRRAADDDVRRGAGAGLRRVQGGLGPRRDDEPGEGRAPPRAHRGPAPRPGRAAHTGAHALRLPRRRRRLREGHRPLRRHRPVPRRRERHHVPELHGHAGGGGLHPRPGPDALRDAAGRGARRLARRPRRGGAGAVPRLQGLQARVPGQRRHGDVQGRVPQPPLPPAPAATARLRHHPHLLVGPAGEPDARRRQRDHPEPLPRPGPEEDRRRGGAAGDPPVPVTVRARLPGGPPRGDRPAGRRPARRRCRTVSRTGTRRRATPPRRCSGTACATGSTRTARTPPSPPTG